MKPPRLWRPQPRPRRALPVVRAAAPVVPPAPAPGVTGELYRYRCTRCQVEWRGAPVCWHCGLPDSLTAI